MQECPCTHISDANVHLVSQLGIKYFHKRYYVVNINTPSWIKCLEKNPQATLDCDKTHRISAQLEKSSLGDIIKYFNHLKLQIILMQFKDLHLFHVTNIRK